MRGHRKQRKKIQKRKSLSRGGNKMFKKKVNQRLQMGK